MNRLLLIAMTGTIGMALWLLSPQSSDSDTPRSSYFSARLPNLDGRWKIAIRATGQPGNTPIAELGDHELHFDGNSVRFVYVPTEFNLRIDHRTEERKQPGEIEPTGTTFVLHPGDPIRIDITTSYSDGRLRLPKDSLTKLRSRITVKQSRDKSEPEIITGITTLGLLWVRGNQMCYIVGQAGEDRPDSLDPDLMQPGQRYVFLLRIGPVPGKLDDAKP